MHALETVSRDKISRFKNTFIIIIIIIIIIICYFNQHQRFDTRAFTRSAEQKATGTKQR